MAFDIRFDNVSYAYQAGTPMEHQALKNVTLTIPSGSYTALIGHTGSGKSTMLQHLNALLKPTSGTVYLGDRAIQRGTSEKDLKSIRKKIGTVFQFPEAQLFEETVRKDIAFGPQNYGVSKKEAEALAEETIELVGLPKDLLEASPFDLSGGQQRRVAIAGVLTLQPEILILDEPTAGLDPKGQREIMDMFKRLQEEKGMTIILATHQMDQVAEYASHVGILEAGELIKTGTPQEIFQEPEWLRSKHLEVPLSVHFSNNLNIPFKETPLTVEELAKSLVQHLNLPRGGDGNAR